MKHVLFLLTLLLSPLFSRAGDPDELCPCKTDSSGLAKLGLLRQYHEMLTTLENANQTRAVQLLYAIHDLTLKTPDGQTLDSAKTARLLADCRAVAGDGAAAFLARADSLGLLSRGKIPAAMGNPDFYKARLACVAVQEGQDGAWVSPDKEALEAMKDNYDSLEESARIWKIAGIAALVLLLALGFFAFLFWQEKNRVAASFQKLLGSFNDLETRHNQLAPENNPEKPDQEMKRHIKLNIPPPVFPEPEKPMSPEFSTPAFVPPPPPALRKIYAGLPNGRLLYRVNDYFEPQSTYFVIEINPDERSGVFRLVDDENTRLHAFSMIDRLRDACELQSTGAPTSSRVDEMPGRVELEGEYWTITRKITLQW